MHNFNDRVNAATVARDKLGPDQVTCDFSTASLEVRRESRHVDTAGWFSRRSRRLFFRLEQEQDQQRVKRVPILRSVRRHQLDQAAADLQVAYETYVREISSPVYAISLATASLCRVLAGNADVKNILDLGSGFSSYAFRLPLPSRTVPPNVMSLDTSNAWLDRTRKFLALRGITPSKLDLWDTFELTSAPFFDVVLLDLGGLEQRASAFNLIVRRLVPGGIIILDDCHKPIYWRTIRNAVAEAGLRFYSLRKWTLDNYGRFAGVAISASHTNAQ